MTSDLFPVFMRSPMHKSWKPFLIGRYILAMYNTFLLSRSKECNILTSQLCLLKCWQWRCIRLSHCHNDNCLYCTYLQVRILAPSSKRNGYDSSSTFKKSSHVTSAVFSQQGEILASYSGNVSFNLNLSENSSVMTYVLIVRRQSQCPSDGPKVCYAFKYCRVSRIQPLWKNYSSYSIKSVFCMTFSTSYLSTISFHNDCLTVYTAL